MQKAAQAYFQTQVATTTQGDLLLMLYEGAIKFLKMAKVKIDERDYAEKGILISKAMDVIAELDSSLNVQKGGDLAQNLHHLYFFCNTRLLKANMNLDTAIIDEVIKVLSGLQEAFQQIISEGAQSGQPGIAPSTMPRQPAAPGTPANGLNGNGTMLSGGLLRPQPGAGLPKAAPATPSDVAQGKGSSAVRPLGANGAARAVQFSQNQQLPKTAPTPPRPNNAASKNAPEAAEKSAQNMPKAAVTPPKTAQKASDVPQPKKNKPAYKQQPVKPDEDQMTTLPKQPLNFSKARMLAGYKKMASQT